MTDMQYVNVDVAQAPYRVLIGDGMLQGLGELIRQELRLGGSETVFIVSEETVAEHWLPTVAGMIMGAGLKTPNGLILPAGEATKSFASYEVVIGHLLKHGAKRDSVVVALGGGVIGDLAGFAAATALRGLRLVQIPTTLLAQVDSSVGGKTGINTGQGKNLVGSFHQPSLVVIDTATLGTLPARELRAGYAEVLKYALLGDAVFFDWLEQHGQRVIDGDAAARAEAIVKSCSAKAAIVAEDPFERTGRRALLNLGHTFGHALEALGGYDGRLLHGEAVAIGMLWALRYSVCSGLMPAADAARVATHMQCTGLMMRPPFAVTAHDVVAAMGSDKKNTEGTGLTLILCRAIGDAFVHAGVKPGDVALFLEDMLAGE